MTGEPLNGQTEPTTAEQALPRRQAGRQPQPMGALLSATSSNQKVSAPPP